MLIYVHSETGKLSYAEYRKRVLSHGVLTCDRTGRVWIVVPSKEEKQAEKEKRVNSKTIVITIDEYMAMARNQGFLTDHLSGRFTELVDDEKDDENGTTTGTVVGQMLLTKDRATGISVSANSKHSVSIDVRVVEDDAIGISLESSDALDEPTSIDDLPQKEAGSGKRSAEALPEDVPEPKSKSPELDSNNASLITIPLAEAIGLQLIANEYEVHDFSESFILLTGPKWEPLELAIDLSHLHAPLIKGFLFESLRHDYETSTLIINDLDHTEYKLQIGAYSLSKK